MSKTKKKRIEERRALKGIIPKNKKEVRKMKILIRVFGFWFLIFSLWFLAGCAARPVKGDIPLVKKELKEIKKELTKEEKRIFTNIYFDFDKSDIKPEGRPVLEKIAAYLLKNPALDLLIEGHCCEIGTNEYNLALGERRALSARRYLIRLGVASGRLQTISYGEERPLDPGHYETAWVKNRRAEFKPLQ